MDYELYKRTVEHDQVSPARETLEPYWERMIRIANSSSPLEQLEEECLSLEPDGRLVLTTGGPHVEFLPTGELRAIWGDRWIYSQPLSSNELDASARVRELLVEISQC